MIFCFAMSCIEIAMGNDRAAIYLIVQTHLTPVKPIETSPA
jgi:hypothetical protein